MQVVHPGTESVLYEDYGAVTPAAKSTNLNIARNVPSAHASFEIYVPEDLLFIK